MRGDSPQDQRNEISRARVMSLTSGAGRRGSIQARRLHIACPLWLLHCQTVALTWTLHRGTLHTACLLLPRLSSVRLRRTTARPEQEAWQVSEPPVAAPSRRCRESHKDAYSMG